MKRTIFAIACALALSACGHKQQAAQQDADTLPAPDAGKGSVTGMPDKPGPGAIGTPAPAMPAPSTVANAADAALPPDPSQGIAVGESNPTAPSPAGNAVEPGPGDAVKLLRDYYAAIAARDYGRAYRLWSENGAASNQSAQQFANGFSDTTGSSVEIGTPGDEDAGAGQRYIEIPVTVTATHADGSRHRYAGSYILHRTVVDGASAEDRAWRINSAKLRETTP
ncbi:hypothetical protein FNZ56_06030 [Pseudoluteimonas lycopersici]|uniref:Lipoprotein n=1 Tax=Pseudoluteimonas lycopersici TaxID=1324796 RepID=A0A516V4P7_9GAMM|nr:hypothetical protein [Lysobacter lycopersici]QDQ73457.1 hypothetical protein FNZ56_06030 [Lysobacter lycopersici]